MHASRPEERSLGVTMMVTTGSISKLLGWGVFRVAPGGGSRAAPTSCEDGNGRRKRPPGACPHARDGARAGPDRSEEHTSELQSLMRISYAVFCLKKKQHPNLPQTHNKLKHHN